MRKKISNDFRRIHLKTNRFGSIWNRFFFLFGRSNVLFRLFFFLHRISLGRRAFCFFVVQKTILFCFVSFLHSFVFFTMIFSFVFITLSRQLKFSSYKTLTPTLTFNVIERIDLLDAKIVSRWTFWWIYSKPLRWIRFIDQWKNWDDQNDFENKNERFEKIIKFTGRFLTVSNA